MTTRTKQAGRLVSFRLTDEEAATLESVRRRIGSPHAEARLVDALRYALRLAARELDAETRAKTKRT